jgi:TonB family protein
MGRTKLAWLGFLLLFPLSLAAQQPTPVNEQILNDHVIERTAPVFPPIAKAARVVGTVVIEMQIGVDGKITSTKVVSGPAMLQQSALDCVNKWKLKPFEKDGVPFVAKGRTSIVFTLGKDDPTPHEEELAGQYFPASDECHVKSRGGGNWVEAAAVCKRAAVIAAEFPSDRRFIEKRSAFVYASWALLMNGELSDARRYADMAVEVVELGHDDNSGKSAAYSVRGSVEAKSGEFAAADQDLAKAEEYERKAIEWAKSVKFEHLDSYTDALNQDLRVHFQLLQTMGRPEEAKKKLDEAPDSQSTESDSTLLSRAHGLYDTPFTRPLISFNCAVRFDWEKHFLDTLGTVPPAAIQTIEHLQAMQHRVFVDRSGAVVSEVPKATDLTGIPFGTDLETSFQAIVSSGINSWLPFAMDEILPLMPSKFNFQKVDTGFKVLMNGNNVSATLMLLPDMRISNVVSELPQPLHFTTNFVEGPNGFLLQSVKTGGGTSNPDKWDASFTYTFLDVQGIQLPSNVTVTQFATGEKWAYSLTDCKAMTGVKVEVRAPNQ